MAASTIYKPVTRKGPVFLTPTEGDPPVITGPDGTSYTAVRGDRAGGSFYNEGRFQWVFPREVLALKDATITYGGVTGKIASGGQSYEGGSIDSWDPRDKGSVGSYGGNYGPGSDPTGLGFFPKDLTSEFPNPVLAAFDPITRAPYDFIDPMEFASRYGEFNRAELERNNAQAKRFALDALGTELEGLEGFVPASSALKRRETSIDNIFNQMEREAQVNRALPNARGDLEAQRRRAASYASGQAPDEIADRALELGVRSNAADRASFGGFGATSSVSRKAQDLASYDERIKIAQYGEGLVSKNIGETAGLFLAPTSYSNAGQQINVMPSISGSQLQTNARQEITNFTGVDARTALGTSVQQRQFETSLEQQTRQFNASNEFAESQFNATTQNQFALDLFGYKVGYAGAVAGAFQTGSNAQIALEQQKIATEITKQYLALAQANQQISSIFEGLGTILGGLGSLTGGGKGGSGSGGIIGAIKKVIDEIGDIINGSDSDSDTGSSDVELEPGGPDTEDAPEGEGGNVELEPGGPSNEGAPEGQGGNFGDEPSGPEQTGSEEVPDVGTGTEQSLARSQKFSTQQLDLDPQTRKAVEKVFGKSLDNPKEARAGMRAAMKAGGLSYQQTPTNKYVGVDNRGRALFAEKDLAESRDTTVGGKTIQAIKGILEPLGFGKKDADAFDNLSAVANSAEFIAQLDAFRRAGDKKGFVNTIIQTLGKPYLEKQVSGGQNKAGVRGAFGILSLFNYWDNMSPARKSLAVASTGLDLYQFATGNNLRKEIIPGTKINGSAGLSYGGALKLFNAGYNVYSLVKNWGQYNDLEKVAYGLGTAASVADVAKNFNLLGNGASGAAVATSAADLATIGFTATPAYGVGAGTIAANASVPTGYTAIATAADGSTVIIPAANAGTAAADIIGGAAGVAGIALGAQTVYKGWGMGGSKGALNGAIGGSSIAAGLYTLGATNPYLLAAVVATSVLGNAIKTGKSEDQMARDAVRGNLKKLGTVDKEYNVTLSDGSKFDIGIDGHGGYHEITDRGKLVSGHKDLKKLNAWDIDYTNDLDYSSGMAGIALARITSGGKGKAIDQLGNQLGNAGIGNIGFGKEMSEANFNKMAANQRGIYAQTGIKNKGEAYALANQAYAEGRISETDLISAHQAFNMIYDRNGYDTAKKLMGGRHKGAEVAETSSQHEKPEEPNETERQPVKRPTFNNKDVDYGKLTERDRSFYNLPGDPNKAAEALNKGKDRTKRPTFEDIEKLKNAPMYSKEEAVNRNRNRYKKPFFGGIGSGV